MAEHGGSAALAWTGQLARDVHFPQAVGPHPSLSPTSLPERLLGLCAWPVWSSWSREERAGVVARVESHLAAVALAAAPARRRGGAGGGAPLCLGLLRRPRTQHVLDEVEELVDRPRAVLLLAAALHLQQALLLVQLRLGSCESLAKVHSLVSPAVVQDGAQRLLVLLELGRVERHGRPAAAGRLGQRGRIAAGLAGRPAGRAADGRIAAGRVGIVVLVGLSASSGCPRLGRCRGRRRHGDRGERGAHAARRGRGRAAPWRRRRAPARRSRRRAALRVARRVQPAAASGVEAARPRPRRRPRP